MDPTSSCDEGLPERGAPEVGGFRRVLLVGFMGAGKTRVGNCLAERLGWRFRDFDEEISSRAGLSIPEIFRQHGEGFFRELEKKVGEDLLQLEGVVLGSGGGWPASSGRMEELDPATFSIWLRVTPEEAIRRASREGATRPLLAIPEPLKGARALLRTREAFYRKAHAALDTEGENPEALAVEIHEIMKTMGPGRPRPLPLHK